MWRLAGIAVRACVSSCWLLPVAGVAPLWLLVHSWRLLASWGVGYALEYADVLPAACGPVPVYAQGGRCRAVVLP